jgi:outer membrane receptor protein involved in Fe transport
MPRVYSLHGAALLLVASAAPIVAAPSTAGAPQQETLDVVQVTARRTSESLESVTPWISVADAETIRRLAPQVAAESLRGQAGAFFQQTAPGQGMTIVRGLKGAEVLHLVDGMRLNNAFFRTAPSQYTALVDPLSLSSVELLRGPAATIYGSDAMGGVVHFRSAEQRFAGSDWSTRGVFRANYNSADVGRQFRFTGAAGRDGLSLAVGASRAEFGARDVAGNGQSSNDAGAISLTDRVRPTEFGTRAYDAKILWTPSDRSEWMFSLQSYDAPRLPRYNEVVPGFGTAAAGFADAAVSEYDNSRHFGHIRYTAKLERAWANSIEVHVARQTVVDDRFDRSLDLTTDVRENNRSVLDGIVVQAATGIGASFDLTYGLDAYRDQVESRRADTRAGVTTVNSPTSTVKSRFPDGARADALGAFAIASWQTDGALRMDGSLRADRIEIDLPLADRLSAGKFDETALSGGVGVSYAFAPAWIWNSNLRRGFRAPNINDLAQVGRRSNNRIIVANPNLKPESLWSIDTGVRVSRAGLRGEAAVFYARYRDRITLADTGVTYANGQNGCVRATGCLEAQNRNFARAQYYGFEGALQWQKGPFETQATVNYTFGEQRNGDVTTPANRVPPLNGTLALKWNANAAVAAEVRAWFAGEQDRLDPSDLRDNRINPNGTPGFATLDVLMTWQPNNSLVVQTGLRNILDKGYREHGSGINGTGRSLALTAEYRFGEF